MAENDSVGIPIGWRNLATKDLFACNPPPVLYHYTDYEGANGILASKSLWLTKIQYINDTSELQFAINLFREVVERRLVQFADEEKREFLKSASSQLESFRQTNRGGSGWLDSVGPSLSGAWRIADYAAVRRVVRWS